MCRTAATFVQMGGMPYGPAGPARRVTLGHEPASEIGAVGGSVSCPKVDIRQGYPTEICEVSPQLAERAGRFTKLISHRFPMTEVHDAFQLALSPGAAKKAVVTFGD